MWQSELAWMVAGPGRVSAAVTWATALGRSPLNLSLIPPACTTGATVTRGSIVRGAKARVMGSRKRSLHMNRPGSMACAG